MTVHVDKSLPTGYVNEYLMLVTNDLQATQIPLLVEGRVLPAVTVSPSSLFMGVVEPGKKVTRQLVVKGKKPFRILSITCDDKSFTFGNVADKTPKTLHLVPVSFAAGKSSGKINRTIKIETDLGDSTPELAAYAVVPERRDQGPGTVAENGDWLRRPQERFACQYALWRRCLSPFSARLTQPWHAPATGTEALRPPSVAAPIPAAG